MRGCSPGARTLPQAFPQSRCCTGKYWFGTACAPCWLHSTGCSCTRHPGFPRPSHAHNHPPRPQREMIWVVVAMGAVLRGCCFGGPSARAQMTVSGVCVCMCVCTRAL
eukprot:scaffold83821_cov22-Tisochrysis_lutea.AAC.1